MCECVRSLGLQNSPERPRCKAKPPARYLPVCVCLLARVQAAACDSMTLLRKKLEHLSDGIQEVRGTTSSHADEAEADGEQPSAVVSSVEPG